MNDLKAAIDRLEENVEYLEEVIDDQTTRSMVRDEALKDIPAFTVALSALRDALQRQPDPDTGLKGCWHCRNIEAHHIEYVIAVKAKSGTPMNTPVDCPYHYCPACGRKLGVEG